MRPGLKHLRIPAALGISAALVGVVYTWTPLVVADDPLVRMPGTQPGIVSLESPNRCMNCHAGYDQQVEPGFNWQGSMMAQSARDFLFWAAMTVAAQDSIWAIGTPNATDICERCHFPQGWLEGHSDPTNASLMTESEFDGVHCDFCHRMWDPFFETTYDGSREGNDWLNYWDETNLSDTPSQPAADATYALDQGLALSITLFNGGSFYIGNLPPVSYVESASGQYFVSDSTDKRASFADAAPPHGMQYSRFHKSRYFCGTCHDVSNPVLENLGSDPASPLPSELLPAYSYFHVERTFSEFMLSAYGLQGGADTNPEFQSASSIAHAASCQDCHIQDVTGVGCNKSTAPLRPDESIEHPNSGVPFHDFTGGNAWVSYVLASSVPGASNYDATNEALLDQGPSALTLDLSQGEGIDPAAMLAGVDRAKQQLQMAATIADTSYDPATGSLTFRILNHTGHKLISGFPEGRRMFVNIKAYLAGDLIYEVNPYDDAAGTLKGLSYSYSGSGLPDPAGLGLDEIYVDELVYEMHPSSDLTSEEETFHFVLASSRYKDNRIPPKGFRIAEAAERLSIPAWQGAEEADYFSPEEYAGGYDQISIGIPAGATVVEINLYYQTTSREYVEFLRDEINGTGNPTLSSPTYYGEPEAYIIQSDPFFSQMGAWGATIWDLWTHNMGVDGATPILMTSEVVYTTPTGDLYGAKFMDSDEDGVFDPAESGLPDWEIQLTGGSLNLSTFTDGDGNYSFEGLPFGTYTLTEVLQPGWDQTYPVTGSWTVVLEAGSDLIADLNFGNTPSNKLYLPLLANGSSP